jgi:hypothetical protein
MNSASRIKTYEDTQAVLYDGLAAIVKLAVSASNYTDLGEIVAIHEEANRALERLITLEHTYPEPAS